ncbi:hypothetical protein PTKIN_Ptkin01aG0342500 [Pterospermum kingtungense]
MTNDRNLLVLCIVWFSLVFNIINLEPSQALSVDCGSDGGKDEDGRTWEPDTKYLVSTKDSVQLQAGFQDPSLISTLPYVNARIFKSPATYKFPIKAKERYILRLHFYPSDYPDMNITNSFFSVVAGGVTLLSNFSASITCQALTQAYLANEYYLAPMDSDVLNITFTPSANHTNSFAFVNGIELIAMPNIFGAAHMVGFDKSTLDVSHQNLQTMFRLNVGGQTIPPSKDSGGLLRTWYFDDPYVYASALGIDSLANDTVRIDYRSLPKASAPEDVYRTSRIMTNNSDMNVKFNLTWTFQVDANFTYVARLHFCEYNLEKVNQKTFNIYLNNQSAQADPQPADIIGWTGGKGIPTYKDYGVVVSDEPGDELVRIDMTPSTASKPEFYNAQLNGVEIFKVNDDRNNLAGANPQPSAMLLAAKSQQQQQQPKKSFKSNNTSIIGGATGGAAVAFVVVAILLVAYSKKKRVHGVESHTNSWLPIYGNSHTTGSKSDGKNNSNHLSTLAQGLSRHFSVSEIKQATDNFDESNVIGVGGFGKVYKGVIDGGTKVAIKRSNPSSEQGINEFQTEIEMLSKLRHKHLVSLIGFCEDGGEMCLVYDYMARGTLREHIYNNKKSTLSWKQRLEICIGAARGLHYLHTGAKYTIIHRDVKTTNILLDENWVAKVSDFGLSKTGPDLNQGYVSTVVKGSFGYLDPEYFRRQQLTEKSDVYSFGVVLFEVLCARPVLNPSLPKEQVSLADWALHCQRKGVLEDIVDPHLKGKINPECLKKFADTAEKCLSDQGIERPHMGDVLWNLEFALQLQETADGSNSKADSSSSSTSSDQESVRSTDSRRRLHVGSYSHGSEHELSEEANNNNNNESAIFSQLVNPKGR